MSRRREFPLDPTPVWVCAVSVVVGVAVFIWLGIPWLVHVFCVASDFWSK